jgi:hypothetical protein
MAGFRDAVREVVSSSMKGVAQTCQGYIVAGTMDKNTHTCTIRVPNQHGGIHPAPYESGNAPTYLEHTGIPYPQSPKGFIESLTSTNTTDIACLVGFKGGNVNFPYIINIIDILYPVQSRQAESTENRESVTANKFSTASPARPTSPPPTNKKADVSALGYPKLNIGILDRNAKKAMDVLEGEARKRPSQVVTDKIQRFANAHLGEINEALGTSYSPTTRKATKGSLTGPNLEASQDSEIARRQQQLLDNYRETQAAYQAGRGAEETKLLAERERLEQDIFKLNQRLKKTGSK